MLNETRKADRAKMAAIVEKLALDLGATCARAEYVGPREIRLEIEAARGLCVSVEFDGDSPQANCYVIPWYMHYNSEARLSSRFGDVNPFHFRKCTAVAYGFDDLCAQLRRGLEMARDGSAFDLEREAAMRKDAA